MTVRIRSATGHDVAAMTAIYAHHVLNSSASFEEVPPDEAEMRQRWQLREDSGYPTLVAERPASGDSLVAEIVGFAYAGNYKPRSAYRYTVEDSIYIAHSARGQGLGGQLLDALIESARSLGYRQMMAVIGDGANEASITLHRRAGFEHIGTAKAIGYKFERWLDVVYMQKTL